MGLGTWLLGKAVDKAADAFAGAALMGATVATTAAVGAAVTTADKKKSEREAKKKTAEQEKKIAQAKNDLAAQEKRIAQEKQELAEQKKQLAQGNTVHSEYDIRLVCAKVAICGYIIYADNQVSEAERNLINSIFESIYYEYGQEVHTRAVQAYRSSTKSFMNVQDYLRKVHVKDIKIYLQAADEIAGVDGIDEAEIKAIQRIKDYIEQQETGAAQSLVCPSCSGVMNIDDYGYKATCACCGREIIVDSSNAPASAYREMTKQIGNTVPETTPVTNDKPATENPAPAKSKKGKVAMKVALGVMTGGVSLIPDAVSAVKKNGKKE